MAIDAAVILPAVYFRLGSLAIDAADIIPAVYFRLGSLAIDAAVILSAVIGAVVTSLAVIVGAVYVLGV